MSSSNCSLWLIEAVIFHATLHHIGFNIVTQDSINRNGFETILDLATGVQDEVFDKVLKYLESWQDPNQNPDEQA